MVADLRRLPALWGVHGRLGLTAYMRSGGEAIAWLLSEGLLQLGAMISAFLVANRFSGIGEWTLGAVLFLLGYGMLVKGLASACFGYNVLMISRRIGRGQLDHTLMQPQPLWMSLASEGFIPLDSALTLAIGVAFMAAGAERVALPGGAAFWPLFTLNLAASVAIFVAYQYAWGSLAFWAPRGAEEINSTSAGSTWSAGMPLDRASRGLQGLLLSAVPIGFIAWLPSRTLLHVGPAVPGGALITPVAAVVMTAVAAAIFGAGLRRYRRTGSSRYLDFGHRR